MFWNRASYWVASVIDSASKLFRSDSIFFKIHRRNTLVPASPESSSVTPCSGMTNHTVGGAYQPKEHSRNTHRVFMEKAHPNRVNISETKELRMKACRLARPASGTVPSIQFLGLYTRSSSLISSISIADIRENSREPELQATIHLKQ